MMNPAYDQMREGLRGCGVLEKDIQACGDDWERMSDLVGFLLVGRKPEELEQAMATLIAARDPNPILVKDDGSE